MSSDPSRDPARRRKKRIALGREVSLKFKDLRGFVTEVSENISVEGMFIRTSRPHAPGTTFDFELLLEENGWRVQGIGEVTWVRSEPDAAGRPAGMGIRFRDLGPGSRTLLHRFLGELEGAAGEGGRRERAGRYEVLARRPAPRPRRRALPAVLGGLLVVTAVSLYLVEHLRQGEGAAADTVTEAPPVEPRPAEPSPATPAPAREPPASPPSRQPAAAPAVEAPRPTAAGRRFSGLEDITWQAQEDTLAVTLRGDGAFSAVRWNHLRLDDEPPRELVRIFGARRPFRRTEMAVGSPVVERIRTGYHRRPGGAELHVVIDLAARDVHLTSIEPQGDRLRLLFTRGP